MSRSHLGLVGLLGGVLISAVVYWAVPAFAAMPEVGESVYLHEDEVLSGPVTLAGYSISVDQPVKGDVFILGQRVTISSKIDGDVTVLARELVVEGEITGDLTAVAVSTELPGKVRGTTSVAAMRLNTSGELATLYAASIGAQLDGKITSTWMLSNQVILTGEFKDVHLRAPLTAVADGASVETLRQVGRTEPVVQSGAKITTLEHRVTPFTAFGIYKGWQAYAAWFVSNMLWLLGFSLVLWRYARKTTRTLATGLRHKVFGSVLTGLTVILVGGSLAIGVAGTRVGIHLALAFALLVLVAAHLGFILFAWVLGGLVARLLWRERTLSLAAVLLGTALTSALLVTPVVGTALLLALGLLGVGSLTRTLLRAKLANEQHDRSQPSPR